MTEREGPRRIFRLPLPRSRLSSDLDEELRFHLEMREEDLRREGWSERGAREEAERQFGNYERFRGECRRIGMRREGTMRIRDWMGAIRQDAAFGLRQLVRAPGTSALAVATLALGIGAATVVFSVVDSVVLEAVPFPDADRLAVVRELTPQGDYFSTSDPNYLDWTRRTRAFESLGAFTMGDVTLTGGVQAERLSGLRVTHTLLPTLGVEPVAGRGIAASEDKPGTGDRVVLLSEGFWTRRFGADPGILGRSIVLDGRAHVVVGVVPMERGFPGIEVLTPLRPDPTSDRTDHMLMAVGRLAPGVSPSEARDDIARVADELAAEYPEANAGWSATVQSVRDWRVGERLTSISLFLVLAVGLLLLMACGSVAAMLVARASGRRREMGVRAALGAGRARIVSQLLTESTVLAVLGGGLGVLAAWYGTPLVRRLAPDTLPRLAQADVDGTVLAAAVALSLGSVLLFGLVPALFVGRGRLFEALRDGSATASGGQRRLRDGLVVIQFALAIVVVLGAGLTARSFARIQAVDLGFRPEGALQFSVGLPDGAFGTAERITFLDQLDRQIRALPGVEAVGLTMSTPFSSFQASNFVAPSDDVPDRQDDFVPVSWRAVDGGFFGAMGIQVLGGRVFGPLDAPPSGTDAMDHEFEPSVILDGTLAEALWGTVDVVGRSVVWGDPSGSTMRVVGVVRAIHDESVDTDPRPRIYLPYDIFPWPSPSMVVRTSVDPAGLVPAIRRAVEVLNPEVPLMDVATLPQVTRSAVAWPRFTMQVVSAFALIAMILAAMGVYGIASFAVQRQRREIGIRVALGAEPRRIMGLILRRSVRLAVGGIALGVLGALAGSRFIGAILYGVAPNDPLTFTLLPAVLALLAVVASWWPAHRATRVDPRDALGSE